MLRAFFIIVSAYPDDLIVKQDEFIIYLSVLVIMTEKPVSELQPWKKLIKKICQLIRAGRRIIHLFCDGLRCAVSYYMIDTISCGGKVSFCVFYLLVIGQFFLPPCFMLDPELFFLSFPFSDGSLELIISPEILP